MLLGSTAFKNSFKALASFKRIVGKKELKQRLIMRRSIVANQLIKKGQKITFKFLDLKRPGNGLSPNKLNSILGKKANVDIDEGMIITKRLLT